MYTNILQTFEKDKNKELAGAKAKNIELQRKKGDFTTFFRSGSFTTKTAYN
jgi:hypothetical protein